MKWTKKQRFERELAEKRDALEKANANTLLLSALLSACVSLLGPVRFKQKDIASLMEEINACFREAKLPPIKIEQIDDSIALSMVGQTDLDTLVERLREPLKVYGSVFGTDKQESATKVILDILGGK